MGRFGISFLLCLVVLFVGVSLALDAVFAVQIPIVRGAVAFMLIAIGIRVLMRSGASVRSARSTDDAWFTDRKFSPEGPLPADSRYDVVFGRGLVDLTHVGEPATDVTISVDAVFGSAVVKVDPTVPYDVSASSAFGEVRLPDRTTAGFGGARYRSKADRAPHLHVRVNAVFGSCDVVEAS